MNEKIIKVFYDQSGLPYKDRELSVHYPLVGSGFLGASNTTKIRFYYKNIGLFGDTYLAVSKMPNGKQGSHLLNIKSQDEDGNYVELSLSEWYFQAKGDVYISLKVYWGGVEISDETDPETGFVVISGEQVKFVTGAIKMSINYAPIGDVPDYRDEFTAYETILELVREKLDMTDSIYATSDISLLTMSLFAENQIFFDYTRKEFYKKVNGTAEMILDIYDKNEIGSLLADKVDKLTTLGEHAYTHNGSTPSEISISENAAGGSVPKRTSAGNIYVGLIPSVSGHATSKKYVDDSITSARTYLLGVINDAGHSLGLVESTDPSKEYDYIIQLKDKAGNVISSVELDLPLEQIITSGYYDEDTKSVVLVLDNGSEVVIPVGDLIEGLVDEQTLETALQPYIKSGKVSSVLTTGDLITNFGLEKSFVLDVMGDLLLCYIEETENSGYYTMSVVGKNTSYKTQEFTNSELVINVLGTGTLEVDYLPIIELATAGQTLNSDQLKVANQDNSVIKYDNRLYHKSNDSGTSLEFVSVDYDIVDEGTNNKITKYEITVNKSSGATNMITMYLNVYSVGEMDTLLNEKANTSGEYPTLTVGKSLVTKQIENINDEVGSTQTNPFLFQGTGTNDNTIETPTAPVAKHLELRGNSVNWNQLLYIDNGTTTQNGVTFVRDMTNGEIVVSTDENGATEDTYITISVTPSSRVIPNGHIVLLKGCPNGGSDTTYYIEDPNTDKKDIGSGIVYTIVNNYVNAMRVYIKSGTIITTPLVFRPQIFDLTQLGVNYKDVVSFNRDYSLPYYEYNEGELKSCSSSKLVTIGCNQLSAFNTFIRVIAGQTYELSGVSDGGYIEEYDSEQNLIKTSNEITSTTQITLTNNTYYVKVQATTYSNTMFRLYWNETHEYVPYIKHEYDLPSVELRSVGSVYDTITPNGVYTKRIDVIDLGNLNWSYNSSLGGFLSTDLSNIAKLNGYNIPNILCSKYITVQQSVHDDKTITKWDDGNIAQQYLFVRDSSYTDVATFKNAMSGVYLFYELEKLIVSKVSAFAENIEVDDFGAMEFVPSDNTEEVIVPQGNKFFYPADYVLFIDDMYNRSKDGGETSSANNFVTQSELQQAVENIDVSTLVNPTIKSNESSTYGLVSPNTTSWTSNKEIATTDEAFNVIYVSEMTDSTHFSQAQLDLLANRKPTHIIGTLFNAIDPTIYMQRYVAGSYDYMFGFIVGANISGPRLLPIFINHSNGTFSDLSNNCWITFNCIGEGYYTQIRNTYGASIESASCSIRAGENNPTVKIRNVSKQIPNYPADTGTFVLKCVNGTLTWVAE